MYFVIINNYYMRDLVLFVNILIMKTYFLVNKGCNLYEQHIICFSFSQQKYNVCIAKIITRLYNH